LETYHNITDYIKAKERWTNAPAVITPHGEMLVQVKDKLISKEVYDLHNPQPNYEPESGNNLNDEKAGLLYGVRSRKKGR